MNITAAIEKRSRSFMVCVTLGLLGVAVLSRYLVPPQFSVAFLFLLPTSFATWFLSWQVGSLVAAVGIFFLAYFERNVSQSAPVEVYWNTFINIAVAGAFIFIFGELRVLYRRQLDLSRRDHLTGLLNRRAFVEFIAIESKRIARHHRPMTIAYIDLDNFKHIN